ncbi:TetR/AcrR family transcriptional regulator [Melioribacteraceae bacterium 4301-Me]|uniref:TetR/AcrR family transcriptional regulator n=1 Tax=Pyranulibacter aquaticus TaxID=3163344 RepID=UPI00359709DB
MTEHLFNVKMPRTKEQNKEIREKTKKIILDSALKLFVEKGFQSTSMSDIAKEAGVSKGLAYNYFDSKQHIVEAILKYLMELVYQAYVPVYEEKDPYIKLEKMIDITFDWIRQNFDFWKMLFTFWLQPEIIETSAQFMKDFIKEMFGLIENIFKEIGVKNYVAEARIIGAIFDGVGVDYLLDTENYPLDEVAKLLKARYSKEAINLLKENY